jgi:hypothetical protein
VLSIKVNAMEPEMHTDERIPSAEGLRRFSTTAGYYQLHVLDDKRYPCTCADTCPPACRGSCNCPACSMAYVDSRVGTFF